MKFYIWVFFKNLSRKFRFHYNGTRIKGTLREDHYTYLNTSRSVLLRSENIANKCCREIRSTHFVFSNFLRKSCRLWDNVIRYCRARQDTWWRMRISCWIPKATNTHTEVVQYSLLFHCDNGYKNAPQCHVMLSLPVLLTPLHVMLWRSAVDRWWSGLSSDLDWSKAVLSFVISYFGHRNGNSLAVRCLLGQDFCEVWGVFIAV